jgi:hypothetical protein
MHSLSKSTKIKESSSAQFPTFGFFFPLFNFLVLWIAVQIFSILTFPLTVLISPRPTPFVSMHLTCKNAPFLLYQAPPPAPDPLPLPLPFPFGPVPLSFWSSSNVGLITASSRRLNHSAWSSLPVKKSLMTSRAVM